MIFKNGFNDELSRSYYKNFLACQRPETFEIFSDFANSQNIQYAGKTYNIGQKSLNEFGFSYEAYHIDYNIYLTDVGGHWSISKSENGFIKFFGKSNQIACSFDNVINTIKNAKSGDRIVILTHPLWWGKIGRASCRERV